MIMVNHDESSLAVSLAVVEGIMKPLLRGQSSVRSEVDI